MLALPAPFWRVSVEPFARIRGGSKISCWLPKKGSAKNWECSFQNSAAACAFLKHAERQRSSTSLLLRRLKGSRKIENEHDPTSGWRRSRHVLKCAAHTRRS